MDYMLLPLKRYADFSGRSRRKEYWMFVLLCILAGMVLSFAGAMVGALLGDAALGIYALLGLFLLVVFIPSLAVQVRRFHDQDRSGWFVLLGFIPYVGGIIALVFMCIDGTRGENRFGPDPKGQDPEELAATFN